MGRTIENLNSVLNNRQPSFDEIRKKNTLEAKKILKENESNFQNLRTIKINEKLVIQVKQNKTESEIAEIVNKFNNHIKQPFIV